jgi:hypothetical protein
MIQMRFLHFCAHDKYVSLELWYVSLHDDETALVTPQGQAELMKRGNLYAKVPQSTFRHGAFRLPFAPFHGNDAATLGNKGQYHGYKRHHIGKGPGNNYIKVCRVACSQTFAPGVQCREIAESEETGDMSLEENLFLDGINRDDTKTWSYQAKRYAGKAGTGADIQQLSFTGNQGDNGQGIEKVLHDDVFFRGYGSEIYLPVPLQQLSGKAGKLPQFGTAQANPQLFSTSKQ